MTRRAGFQKYPMFQLSAGNGSRVLAKAEIEFSQQFKDFL